MITLSNFTIGYKGRDALVSHADATFANGRLTALLGRNGSGKSTMLRAMAALGRDYRGKIGLDGVDLHLLDAARVARSLAFVTTGRTRIANLTSFDLVAMGRAPYTNWIGRLQPADRLIVDEALEAVGMSGYADRTLDKMSDGECQRVMIARALAQSTRNIILDEPTSFLDLPNRYELMRLLASLAHDHGKCIVMSTHELDIACKVADDIALIDGGQLIHLPVERMVAAGHIDRVLGIRI